MLVLGQSTASVKGFVAAIQAAVRHDGGIFGDNLPKIKIIKSKLNFFVGKCIPSFVRMLSQSQ
jgi:hypothetical protein